MKTEIGKRTSGKDGKIVTPNKGASQKGSMVRFFLLLVLGMAVVGGGLVALGRPDLIQSMWSAVTSPSEDAVVKFADDEDWSDFSEEGFDENFEEIEISDEDIVAWIDDVAGHPDDASLPSGVMGASDEILMAADPLEIRGLLEDLDVQRVAASTASPARVQFALGRAALVFGYTEVAKDYLIQAAERGSAAAWFYLADAALTTSTSDAARYLRQSAELGFQPAQKLIADAQRVQTSPRLIDFNKFTQPDVVRALAEGRRPDQFGDGEFWLYISGFITAISSEQNVLLMQEPLQYHLELNPTLEVIANMRAASFEKTILNNETLSEEDSVTVGVAVLALLAPDDPRYRQLLEQQQRQIEERNQRRQNTNLTLKAAQTAGRYDGLRLVLMAEGDPDGFRRIYHGIVKAVVNRPGG